MVIKVMYGGKEVLDRTTTSPWGCRVSYGPCPLSSPSGQPGSTTDCIENIYGPSQAESVSLPSCAGLMKNEKQERLGMELLERGLRRGIVLKCKNNNLYAYRLCQSAVFYSSRLGTNGIPVKLRRVDASNSEPVRLFDYHDQYIPALRDYLDGKGNRPDPYCYLVFGQEASLFNLDSNVLVAVAVTSRTALDDLEIADTQMAVRTPKVEVVSNSNELDSLARTLMSLCQRPETTQPNFTINYSPTEPVPASSGQSPWDQSLCNATSHTQQNQPQDVLPVEEGATPSTGALI